ncbi:hypothetical protein E2C01_033387 [Portunus trituberculatus]|uniref:Uncharacterized protein n=1 Tax=Portunus trituberculatus TaxID=210409 RepID=A0A5B7F3X6_PORTR|nr:hypothetical protein [Portunus trituberculatus]
MLNCFRGTSTTSTTINSSTSTSIQTCDNNMNVTAQATLLVLILNTLSSVFTFVSSISRMLTKSFLQDSFSSAVVKVHWSKL